MIKLFGRMLPVLARAHRAPTLPATQVVTSHFRVLPHDIDINKHLNNGRYLQLIDLNRAEWLIRTGIWAVIRRNQWKPILGAVSIQYRRELRLWDRARIETSLLGWDNRWTYLEHRVLNDSGRTMALSLAKAGFRSRGRWVDPDDLRAQLPHPLSPMTLPDDVHDLLTFEATPQAGRPARLHALG
jgi:acyl-CoA thioesterase FadM